MMRYLSYPDNIAASRVFGASLLIICFAWGILLPYLAMAQSLTVATVDDQGSHVLSPVVPFGALSFDFAPQVMTGTLGTNTARIRVSNTTTSQSWTATIAAQTPTALWADGGSHTLDFNDGSTGGGQLTINPSVASVAREDAGSTEGISLGSAAAFVQGTTDSITLFSSTTAAVNHSYDLTGVGLSQTVPAQQPVGDYEMYFVITVS